METFLHIRQGAILLVCTSVLATVPDLQLAYRRGGDVVLGGLFPVHVGGNCDSIPIMWSLQLVEAMVFAIDQINNRSDLLTNLSLGFDIRDTCFNEDVGLMSALSLIQTNRCLPPWCRNSTYGPSERLAGIVGPMGSTVSIIVGAVADLYEVPMIAFAATSDELSDKERFPYFLRTVPPDRLQAEAMVDIITYMGWEYMSIIYQTDTYGIRGANSLVRLAESRGVCVARLLPIHPNFSIADMEELADELWQARRARVLVIFAGPEIASAVVSAVEWSSDREGHFIWIGSESWAHGLSRQSCVAPIGTVFLSLHNPEPEGFLEHLSGLRRDTIEKNPWFAKFLNTWERVNNCTVWDDERCGVPHLDQYTTASPMAPVIDGVYAFANALHSLVDLKQEKPVDGKRLLKQLRGISFHGQRGHFQFNSEGDMEGKYLLKNARMEDGEFQLVSVGIWDALADTLHLTFHREIVWGSGTTQIPTSTCTEVCVPGFKLVPMTEKCCFGCVACAPHAIVVNVTECIDCRETEWPDEMRSSCTPITPMQTDWSDPLHLTISILSCMGFALSAMITIGLVVSRNHSVVKAASRELCCVNVVGLILAYVATLFLIAHPTRTTCCLSEALVCLSFTMSYAPTLLKVSRIYRIFQAGKKTARRPRFTSPKNQLLMVFLLILVQVLCVILSSSMNLSEPSYLTRTPRDGHLELYCALSVGFLVSSTYNLVLILASCVFAFLARSVPDNYNESKFIGVSVYSTLVVLLAAIPVYYMARDSLQKMAAQCLAVLVNAYLTAFCLYIPKLYAIKFIGVLPRTPAQDLWASNRVSVAHTSPTASDANGQIVTESL